MNIAVIGTGIAGLGAALALDERHAVTVYEARERLGGHSHTVDVATASGRVPVDTGFIVYNERTYPNLTRLFGYLGVETEASDMSFAFSVAGGVEYAGSLGGLVAAPTQLLRPRYRAMISDILRFRKEGRAILEGAGDATLSDVLHKHGFSPAFTDDYLMPMAAAIWSARISQIRQHPAASLLDFFSNHGLIRITDRPQWRTVTGGSRRYVTKVAKALSGQVRLRSPVRQVIRHPDRVDVTSGQGERTSFDHVVIATHTDQALEMLGAGASEAERSILGRIGYEPNRAVLHSDQSLMPRRRRLWSSWNYLAQSSRAESSLASVTYWMNRLQNLKTDDQVFVSLNPIRDADPELVHGIFQYSHPQFDQAARLAQLSLPKLQGLNRTWFAGAWTGNGFHEDGLRSGLSAAAALGGSAPWRTQSESALEGSIA